MTGFTAGLAVGGLAAWALCAWRERRRQKILGRFLAFASHELNTPITSVNMTVLNFLGGVFGDLDSKHTPWFEMLREQLARLVGMTGDLRDFVHGELLNDMAVRVASMPLGETLQSAIDGISYGAAQSGIAIDANIPDDLPAVRADPNRLPRILMNILFHARRFRLEGPLEISAALNEERTSVEIEVRYIGPKLSPEEARQSLDIYFPARQRRDENLTATGLGMGLLKDFLRLQGCSMDFKVASDGKSVFRIRVPVEVGEPAGAVLQ